jgi:hypothetical protein
LRPEFPPFLSLVVVRRVDDLSGENKRHIDVLAGEIGEFKTGNV